MIRVRFFPRILVRLLELVFPEDCLLCGAEVRTATGYAAPVCRECRGRLTPIAGERCPVCGTTLVSEESVCTRCRERDFSFDRHRALFEYTDEIRELIHFYKFKGRRRIGRLFAEFFHERGWFGDDPAWIVPVPSLPRSVRKRGFAHVELMARHFSRQQRIPLLFCLKRNKSVPQKSLRFDERMRNVHGAFSAKVKINDVRGKNCILVDDVFTTGATAHECATILKENGAKHVTVVTVAMET